MTKAGARRRADRVLSRSAHRVLEVEDLSSGAFILRFSRDGLDYRAGQWVSLGLPGTGDMREYTLFSSPCDSDLEVLVKEIPRGRVSPALRRCQPGDAVHVDGPRGSFAIDEGAIATARFLFIATGTGVSPFRCFARAYPGLDYRLLHGVRDAVELYGREDFDPVRQTPCISGSSSPSAARSGEETTRGVYAGRVTAYLADHPVNSACYCYLCGNSDMIYEVFTILRDQGVPRSRIFAEVYF